MTLLTPYVVRKLKSLYTEINLKCIKLELWSQCPLIEKRLRNPNEYEPFALITILYYDKLLLLKHASWCVINKYNKQLILII